jgi:hypothetical protein
MDYGHLAYLVLMAIFGHLVGDFILQPKKWAVNKSEKGWRNAGLCSIHVLVYTASVCLFWQTTNPIIGAAIYIPHWIIDRFSLANRWLTMIKSRTFKSAISSERIFREFDIAFTAVVYTITDNTFHILCLWIVITQLADHF